MFIISKITQRYDAEQDRICLSAQDSDAQVLLLWLTQRLANRLAMTLSNWLDESLKMHTAGQSVPGLHAWEQAAAQAQLKPDHPVESAMAKGAALLHSIDLSRNQRCYTMTFKWQGDAAAQLSMNDTELRQWLGILYRLFDTAEWSRHAWPQWFAASADAPSPMTHVLH